MSGFDLFIHFGAVVSVLACAVVMARGEGKGEKKALGTGHGEKKALGTWHWALVKNIGARPLPRTRMRSARRVAGKPSAAGRPACHAESDHRRTRRLDVTA